MCLFGSHQYSDGKSSVVALRSASVMIQSLVPFESVYADRSRNPWANSPVQRLDEAHLDASSSRGGCRPGSSG
jgi:hypothetical protein